MSWMEALEPLVKPREAALDVVTTLLDWRRDSRVRIATNRGAWLVHPSHPQAYARAKRQRVILSHFWAYYLCDCGKS